MTDEAVRPSFRHHSTFQHAQSTVSSETKLNGMDPELVEGPRGGCEGRGDIGVRFDRLNELGGRKIPEIVDGFLAGGARHASQGALDALQAQGLAR